ncbi:MAG TPA: alpha/beta hydrolase-fold protein [Rugosimonospora sp.]|nr:alpha/beta hydrolase-fold protein [Rugosimonospora sp.]
MSDQPTQRLPTIAPTTRTAALSVRRRRRRRVVVWAAVLLAVVAVVVAGWAGAFDQVPLLNAVAATAIEVCGGVLLVAGWYRRDRAWLTRTLPVTLLAVAALVGVIAAGLWVTGTVTDAYPPSFAVWVGAGFAAAATCPLVLRHHAPGRIVVWRKAAAVAAVPLSLAGAFLLIDQEYGIWPQVGDVLGHTPVVNGEQGLRNLINGARPGGTGPAASQGVIVALDAPATVSHFPHRSGVVFLPPAYFGPQGGSLPVLVMLVGAPGTPINWLRAGHGKDTDNAYAASHHGVAPVLVVVDQNGSAIGDSECVDSPAGNAETYLAVDVPAFITGTLHLRHDPARWGIVGFSEGGTCALTLVLRHPDIYRHLIDFGGDARPNLGSPQHTLTALYRGSVADAQAHDPAHLLATRQYPGVTAWFGAGVDDARGITVGQHMAMLTRMAGIPTHAFTGAGGHNWQFAAAGLATIFNPLCDELGCTGHPTPATPVTPPTHRHPSPAPKPTTRRKRP